jgi:hypothetical protein
MLQSTDKLVIDQLHDSLRKGVKGMVINKIIAYCKEVSDKEARLVVIADAVNNRVVNIQVNFEKRLYDFDLDEFRLVLNDIGVASKLAVAVDSDDNLISSGIILLYVNDQVIQFSAELVRKGVDLVIDFLQDHRIGGATA